MSVPTVGIHVELPAYSSSFDIQVPEDATVLDVKQAISSVCIGHPRPDGQRVIWRGRYLDDQEIISDIWTRQDDQRTVHLSVQSSAWTSDPLNVNTSSSPPLNSATYTGNKNSSMVFQQQSSSNLSASNPNDGFSFIRFKHLQALYWLSNSKLAAPAPLEDANTTRSVAKFTLERLGYTWPAVLDATAPMASPPFADFLDYKTIILDGKAYLSLQAPRGTPSPLQVHALHVLTYTFSILDLPPSRPVPTPTISASDTSSIPPHVNDLLRELGLPPLRAVPNANIDVNVQQDIPRMPAVLENAEANVFREIPIRALLAPLLMVVFRTVLLLYFFSPTQKPLLGLCLVAWIIYEMWTHVRVVILRPLDRAGGNEARVRANGAQAGEIGDAAPAVAPAAPDNNRAEGPNRPRPEGRPSNTEPTRDAQQVQGPPVPRQSHGIVDGVAVANVHHENKLLWPVQQSTMVTESPSFLHKVSSFFCLLLVTLHPEVYNRRRVVLRQREGRLRMEMNTMEQVAEPREDGLEVSEEERRKDALRGQLQAQHARRTVWVKQYVERVRQDDWMEE